MVTVMKILRAAAAVLVGLTLGTYAFLNLGGVRRPLWLDPEWRKLKASVEQSDRALHSYRTADYATAKNAMLAEVRRLDALSADAKLVKRLLVEGRLIPDNAFASDAMMTCVRLAKLEEKNGGGGATDYMAEAVVRCRVAGRGNCSAEMLRRTVNRMDAAIK